MAPLVRFVYANMIVLTLFVGSIPFARADSPKDSLFGLKPAAENAGFKTGSSNALPTFVKALINAFLSLLGIVFIILLIYGGTLWMTARGNSEQVTKAFDTMLYAAIGLALILASYGIATFVITKLQGAGT